MENKSQHNIEDHIKKFFPTDGVFLEIGCWDGENISQTSNLEKRGWIGTCVDPFPINFANRDATVIHRAISKDGLDREFIKVHFDKRDNGDVSYFSGFKDNLKDHWELISTHCHYTSHIIKTLTIDKLYEDYSLPKYIHFLSIDTEGSEYEILSSIDFNKYKFGMIVFEHNDNTNTRINIGHLLQENDYRFYGNLGIDDIYISNNLIKLLE